ncbi:MAG: T9SS type A sorting domain-containing protein, partial [Bacteroidia bacterium]|nr:T9SS type A sorting domain-containing protein [Bacteroidia bacterium]
VFENALPVVDLGADDAYCAGTPYSNVLDAGNSGSTYLWNDNTSNQTLNVTASGTYSVTVTDGNGCVNADTITVVENALPIITVTQNGNELTADESATGTTYLWIDCDNNNTPVIGQIHQQFTPTQNGNYAVVVTTQGGCSDTSACIPVTNVGVNENVVIHGVTIYPNPTSGSITVNTDKIYENLTVKISDVSGKVLSIETVQNTQKVLVNMNGSKGVYFVHIYTDKEMLSVQRVIKD